MTDEIDNTLHGFAEPVEQTEQKAEPSPAVAPPPPEQAVPMLLQGLKQCRDQVEALKGRRNAAVAWLKSRPALSAWEAAEKQYAAQGEVIRGELDRQLERWWLIQPPGSPKKFNNAASIKIEEEMSYDLEAVKAWATEKMTDLYTFDVAAFEEIAKAKVLKIPSVKFSQKVKTSIATDIGKALDLATPPAIQFDPARDLDVILKDEEDNADTLSE